MKQITRTALFFALLVMLAFGQQGTSPITREGLLGALKTRALSGRELIGEVHTYGVSFELTTADEEQIRRAGKYLGRKGLDDLIAAIRSSYRGTNIFPATDSNSPLVFLRNIPFAGGSPQRLDVLMKAAGYRGPTAMSALIVASDETNAVEIIVGTTQNLNSTNGQLLYPADSFNFPGGEDTTTVYIVSAKAGKIDVTYRAKLVVRSASPTPTPDWKESDEAKKLASEILTEIQTLIDEGKLIDLTDYQAAAKAYLVWVEKSSVSLGRVDIKLRRFAKKDTEYKDDFDKATANGRNVRPSNKDYESSDREILRINIKIALGHLNLAKQLAEIETRPDADVFKGIPKD